MKKTTFDPATLSVASPCTVPWNAMQGDNGSRHCAQCDKNVHDLSRLTLKQIEAISLVTGGNFCGRITRDPHGRMLTADDFLPTVLPPGRPRGRSLPIAGVSLALFLGMSGTVLAQQPDPDWLTKLPKDSAARKMFERQRKASQALPEPKETETNEGGTTATASGIVRDEDGNPMPGVAVTLILEETGAFNQLPTNDRGEFSFSNLQPGNYHLFVGEERGIFNSYRTLGAGTSWRTEVYRHSVFIQFSTSGSVCLTPLSPLSGIFAADAIALVSVGDFQPRKTEEGDSDFEETIPLDVITTAKGNLPTSRISIKQTISNGEYGMFKPGNRILVFLSRETEEGDQPSPFKLQMAQANELNPGTLDRKVEWIRNFVTIAENPDTNPKEIIELLVSGVEDPANTDMASDILNRLNQETQDRRNPDAHPDEEDANDRAGEKAESRTISNTLTYIAKWGAKRDSLFSKSQKARLIATLHRIPNDEPIPDELLSIVESLPNQKLNVFLGERLAAVSDMPSDMNVKDLRSLEERVDCPESQALYGLWYAALGSNEQGPSEEILRARKIALFRARLLAVRRALADRDTSEKANGKDTVTPRN